MQLSTSLFAIFALVSPFASASWVVYTYKSGCPATVGDNPASVVAGEPGQTLWCIPTNGDSHDLQAVGLDSDNMKVELYADWLCQDKIGEVHSDTHCNVVPSNVSLQ
jgi:hypothetical protein